MIQQTLFKTYSQQTENLIVFCKYRAKCVLSILHSNLHVEALGKNMIVLNGVISPTCVILVCL